MPKGGRPTRISPSMIAWNRRDGLLPVECWCRLHYVAIRPKDVGVRTESCGEADCRPPRQNVTPRANNAGGSPSGDTQSTTTRANTRRK